jgi:hypothetical protein
MSSGVEEPDLRWLPRIKCSREASKRHLSEVIKVSLVESPVTADRGFSVFGMLRVVAERRHECHLRHASSCVGENVLGV